MSQSRAVVIGEAVIDLVPSGEDAEFEARPGGSPYNVAIGLARLGQQTSLMARIADNAFGRILRAQAVAEGVDLAAAPVASEPTTLAVVSLDDDAQATYDFYVDGTADWQWTDHELDQLPADTAVLHFGSIASWTPPAADRIHALVSRVRGRGDVLVSYDPNVRPQLLGDPQDGRMLVERCVAVADLIKASHEDIDWLYPGWDTAAVAARWAGLGAALIVITAGADGAWVFFGEGASTHRAGRQTTVVDTVGAGDAFASALVDGLLRRRIRTGAELQELDAKSITDIVDTANLAAALTCERTGADPPTNADLALHR